MELNTKDIGAGLYRLLDYKPEMFYMTEENPFEYLATHSNWQGYTRYATCMLYRSKCRRFWESEDKWMRYVIDDYGYLVFVHHGNPEDNQ